MVDNKHIVGVLFDFCESVPPTLQTDEEDLKTMLAESYQFRFCPNCGQKLEGGETGDRVYGLKGMNFSFKPLSDQPQNRRFNFCPFTGQRNGNFGKLVI
ncbi:MAG: hypothetical protein ACOCP8_02745 [archaeon]